LIGNMSCDDCRSGSNNWAVAGSRSVSGFPLVSNDMHLNLMAPDIWYEAGLHVGEGADAALDVVGFTLPGAPFVIVGRNAHVAWGFTNLGSDVQDVRVEHLRGSGENTEFERPDGTWALATHHHELIRVRGGHDVPLDVLTTEHSAGSTMMETPIISPLYPSEHRALSLSWVVYDSDSVRVPFMDVDMARDGASLVAALASFGGPSLNLVYADDAKHIGFHVVGRIPIRGPAVKRPRVVEPFVLPEPSPDSDEGEGEEPNALLRPPSSADRDRAHLVLSAFYQHGRERPRTANAHAHATKGAPAKSKVQAKHDETQEQPIPLPAPVLDYTIGSPLSPVPVDAMDASQEWSAYIPYSDLPAVLDPPDGVIATANSRVTTDDYPYAITSNWVDAYRAERIYKLLRGKSGLTPAAMLGVQNDVHSEFDLVLAHKLAYAVDHASPAALQRDGKRLKTAANLMRLWKGEMSVSAAAPAIVVSARDELWPMLLSAQIRAHDGNSTGARAANELVELYRWNERDSALEALLQHTPARWLPHGYASWNDFLVAALARGLDDAHAPGDLSRWHYDDVHRVEIAHPVLGSRSIVSRLLGVETGSEAQPVSGDATTVKATGAHFGPSERFTADLGNAGATMGNITTGESGNPASPWYLDQFAPWLAGTTFAMPLDGTRGQHRLTLVPQ
jgi:penicillin G amidase